MPAIQEKEKAFQSMQDSLDKIEKNTSSLGDLSESWRMTMEENKAQRLRDKEQEKQTKAIEKIGDSSKKGMATWKKILIAGLGTGFAVAAILDLMKGKWPWSTKDKNPKDDLTVKNVKNAFFKMVTKGGWKEVADDIAEDKQHDQSGFGEWMKEKFGYNLPTGSVRESAFGVVEPAQRLAVGVTDGVRKLNENWKNWTNKGKSFKHGKRWSFGGFGGEEIPDEEKV